MTVYCVTGHRSARLGGYGDTIRFQLRSLATGVIKKHQPSRLCVGMALGWDQAVAEAAHELRVPFVAYVPFPGQDAKWPEVARRRYQALLAYAEQVVQVSRAYSPEAMHLRNEAMVRDSEAVLALYDGSGKGGTAHCVAFASRMRRPVHNVWSQWVALGPAQQVPA